MKFRIRFTPGVGYYPQVKTRNGILSIACWYRIGKHINGFGLYPAHETDHPLKSRNEAITRCQEYKAHAKILDDSKDKDEYYYLDESVL